MLQHKVLLFSLSVGMEIQEEVLGERFSVRKELRSEALSSHTIEGPVLRRQTTSGFIITWQNLSLVLLQNILLLYPEKRDEESSPIDVITLDSSFTFSEVTLVTVTGKSNCFCVESKSRSIEEYFCAETKEKRGEWLEALTTIAATTDEQTTDSEKKTPLPQGTKPPNSFRVCSYNINYGLIDPGIVYTETIEIRNSMVHARADILLLQETTRAWEEYLKGDSWIKRTYPYSIFREGEHNIPAGGIGLFSKYPIKELHLIPSPVGWFAGHLCEVAVPNFGPLQILNLHLRPPISPHAFPTPKAYFDSKTDRLLESKKYATYIDLDKPLVVCGDFNEPETFPSAQFWMNDFGLKSSLKEYGLDEQYTWWWQLPLGIKVGAHFDHLFYQGLECLSAEIIKSDSSDHYPCIATFSLSPPGSSSS